MLDWGAVAAGEAAATGEVHGSSVGTVPRSVLLSLVPNSAIQFVDFEMSEEAVARIRRRFLEDQADGEEPSLHVAAAGDGVFYHPVTNAPCNPAHTYTLGGVEALEPFLGTWLPMPYMRVSRRGEGDELVLDEGPSNWTRVHLTRHRSAAGEWRYRVVLAIDTAVEASDGPAGRSYVGPTLEDLKSGAAFRFSDDVSDVAWFVSEAWVDDWIKATYDAVCNPEGEPQQGRALEHLATYLTLLVVLKEACDLPALRFMEPNAVGAYAETVPVDLALDLGTSRTVALLEERQAAASGRGRAAAAATSVTWQLPVRDLSEPWRMSSGILASRLVFARASFGNDALSRWSGRTQAFHWPSPVRLGREAERLASEPALSEAVTGVSSPMNYVWDERPTSHVWRFAGQSQDGARRNPVVSGSVLACLTESGELAEGRASHGATTKPRFSRSSLVTLHVAEILLHAIAAINEPEARERRGRPGTSRRLERIVVTPPAGMPEPEVAILRRRAEAAVRLVWQTMGWNVEAHPLAPPPPTVTIVADTATSAQIAYLENEIAYKLSGKAESLLAIAGRSRAGFAGARALRIATLDVGGATKGLSVVTYELGAGGALAASRQLVEGFETGCEAVVKVLAERYILAALERRLADCRHGDPRRLMTSLLGEETRGRPSWVGDLGRRLAADLLMPAATALLRLYVHSEADAGDAPAELTIATLLASVGADAQHAADRLDAIAADEGADGFSPLDVAVPFLMRDLAGVAREVLRPMLDNVVRVLAALDCDIILLAGGGAQLPVVTEAILEGMPLRPDRVIALNAHRWAGWLPGMRGAGAIGDAKLLPAVGALLQARGTFGNDGPALVLRALERTTCGGFVGRLGPDGRMVADDVLFEPLPGDGGQRGAARETAAPRQRNLSTVIPAAIGSRTPSIEAWQARATWVIERDPAIGGRPPKAPLRVALELSPAERGQPVRLKLLSATDADGVRLDPGEVVLRLKTRRFAEGYWLDTGHLIAASTGISP